jgi:hypothetical protein
MLRHTWATQMLNAGAPLNYVSRALGHHSTAFTASVYAAAQPEPRHEDVDKFVAGISGDATRSVRDQVTQDRTLPEAQPSPDPNAPDGPGLDQAPDGPKADTHPVGDFTGE